MTERAEQCYEIGNKEIRVIVDERAMKKASMEDRLKKQYLRRKNCEKGFYYRDNRAGWFLSD